MGFACSDAKKRPTYIPQIKRFCSFEEISDRSIISFYTAGDQNVDFGHRSKNERRNVSYSQPARLKYYGRTKTKRIDRKTVTLTEQGASQTFTISRLITKRRFSCDHIVFQKKGDGFDCMSEYSDMDGTPAWSQTQTETVSSDACPSSKVGNGETKSETNVSSHSSISPAKVLKAKHIET